MRRVFQFLSWISLAATILPAMLYLTGEITLEQSQQLLLLATIGWFVHTPLWMGREDSSTRSPTPDTSEDADSCPAT